MKDGKADHITREPEQVKAFRDTWRDGIHSYLTYLRDRLTVARDLLTDSGSIFVQIGDENVHRVRAVMDEVFGDDNFVAQITFAKDVGGSTGDYLTWRRRLCLWLCKKQRSMQSIASFYSTKKPRRRWSDEYNCVGLADRDNSQTLTSRRRRWKPDLPTVRESFGTDHYRHQRAAEIQATVCIRSSFKDGNSSCDRSALEDQRTTAWSGLRRLVDLMRSGNQLGYVRYLR